MTMDLRIFLNIFDRNPDKTEAILSKMVRRSWQYCFGPRNWYKNLPGWFDLKDLA
jgi:hypothetical protein